MTVKMSDDASLLRRGGSEIDGQHPAAGLEHSSNLGSALAAELARQMMQHHRAQHHVELSIGERQRLDQRVLEDNIDPSLARLLVGPREHLRRGVNPVHCACGSNPALGRDRKRASSAAHIQDLLAGGQACEAKDLFPKSTFSTERQQPEREVIDRRLVKNEAGGTECLFCFRRIRQFTLLCGRWPWFQPVRHLSHNRMNMDNCSKSSLSLSRGTGKNR